MKNWKALAVGALVGFLAAVVPSCTSGSNSNPDGGHPDGGPSGCTGCLVGSRCVPPGTSSFDSTQCGLNGVACVACVGTNICQNGSCVPPNNASDAGHDAGTPMDAGIPVPFGSACSTNSQCRPPSGAGCIPEHYSDGGPTSFTGGYCTASCNTQADCAADTSSICIRGFGVCGSSCAAPGAGQSNCRETYVCSQVRAIDGGIATVGACIPNCNNPGSGCVAGQSCNTLGYCENMLPTGKVGNACTVDSPDCVSLASTNGTCTQPLLPDGGQSGWTDGYCTSACYYDEQCSSDGGSICVDTPSNPITNECRNICPHPTTGQDTCRTGYVCTGIYDAPDGGIGSGVCMPNCNTDNGDECSFGTYCAADGYCEPSPPTGKVGDACEHDVDCQTPQNKLGRCLSSTLPDGGLSGFSGGLCISLACASNSDCATDGTGSCITIQQGLNICVKNCPNPGTGQDTCRTADYVCDNGRFAGYNVCWVNCNAPGVGACPTGTHCNSLGYCR